MEISAKVARQIRELEIRIKDMRNEMLFIERQIPYNDDVYSEQQIKNKLKLTKEQINLLTSLLVLLRYGE